MTFLLYILCVAATVLLVLAGAVTINRSKLSRFELHRRKKAGDNTARVLLEREEVLHDLLSLQRMVIAVLLVLVTVLALIACGLLAGALVSLAVALLFDVVGQWGFVHRRAQKYYDQHEQTIINYIAKHPKLFKWLRQVTHEDDTEPKVWSREELFHIVESSEGVLNPDEKNLVTHGLTFAERRVRDHMTPVDKVSTVAKGELLGPLVLDDLHKTGHSRFPVTDGGIDKLVGTLHLRDLLTLDSGRGTATVEAAMEPRVYYVHQDQTLDQLLSAFLASRHHLFVVVDDEVRTVGVISLEDVTEALLGRRIEDEYDDHENPRAVATRGNS